ncbi:MAG: hypothetical protein WAQ25_02330 [Candidatus Saccharimonas sp.]
MKKSIHTTVVETDTPYVAVSPLVPMTFREILSSILSGVGVGVVVTVCLYLLNTFVFSAVLCRPQSMTECTQAPGYAMIVAMVLGQIAGVIALARLRIYRPLLVVLASVIALWGVNTLVQGAAWYIAALVIAMLFGLVYGLFAWVTRIRSFILAIVVAAVLVVVIRLVLAA